MGFYIQTGANHGKAQAIADKFGGEVIETPPQTFGLIPADKALIVCIDNGAFEAALFACDEDEFVDCAFAGSHDPRARTYALIDRATAERESGFTA